MMTLGTKLWKFVWENKKNDGKMMVAGVGKEKGDGECQKVPILNGVSEIMNDPKSGPKSYFVRQKAPTS